ncbi:MAG: ParB N-terminal domain-containing protein [Mycobacteriales bacterium]
MDDRLAAFDDTTKACALLTPANAAVVAAGRRIAAQIDLAVESGQGVGDPHPAAELSPILDPAELAELAADIAEHGLTEPVWLWDDPERGVVLLDGRNRVQACEAAGVQVAFRYYPGDDPIGFSVSANLRRRHLSAGQRAALGYAVRGSTKQRRRGGCAPGVAPVSDPGADRPQGPPEVPAAPAGPKKKRAPRAAAKAAKAAGGSARSLTRSNGSSSRHPTWPSRSAPGRCRWTAPNG